MTVSLDQPEALWALLAVVAWVGVDRWAGRRWPGIASRGAVLALFVLALAGPAARWSERAVVEVHVIDASESIPDRALGEAVEASSTRGEAAGVPVGRVSFAAEARVDAVPGAPWPDAGPARGRPGSDLAGALTLAGRLVPEDRAGRVVVYSDGRAPSAIEQAEALAARGIEVVAEAVHPGRPEPGLAVLTPERVEVTPGQTLAATVVVHGGRDGVAGEVSLSLDGRELTSVPVEVAPEGRATVRLEGSVPVDVTPGLVALRAEGAGAETAAGVRVVPPPRVWVVGDRTATTGPLVSWLRADGVDARAVSVAELPPEVPELEAVVLVDVPVAADRGGVPLPAGWAAGLQEHVREGGGLVVVGGERSYDQGGWTDTELAGILPVRLTPRGRERDDAATLVLALDKSGSMATPVSGGDAATVMGARLTGGGGAGSRFQHVQLAAMAAVRALRESDAVGVLAVDTEARWAVPVTSAADELPVVRTIGKLTAAGGGLHVRAALQEGLTALRRAETPLRHMIVFADADDVDGRVGGPGGHPLDVVRLLARDDVTVSVIAVGPGDSRILADLEQLALEGGGRFLHARTYGELKALFVAEAEQLVGQGLEEGSIGVVPGAWHPALRGVDLASAPDLLGRNRVEARPRTRIWATDPDGAPLTASWRVGLGEVVAVATDLGGGWGRPWQSWSGLPRLWTQTVRHVARRVDGDGPGRLTVEDGVVRLAHQADGAAPALRWACGDDGGETSLRLAEPGVWEAANPVPAGRRGTLTVVADGAGIATRDVWPPSSEDAWRTPDTEALDALARAPTAAPVPTRALALGPWLLVVALVLLPLDAWLRRRRHRS